MILADNKLLQLPLEGLSIFSEPNVNAVSRDFSLQVLANRLEKYVGDEASGIYLYELCAEASCGLLV